MKRITGVLLTLAMLFTLVLTPVRVTAEGEAGYAAEGDWTFSDPVLIIAESAGRPYNGEPLTAANAEVIGLPDELSMMVGLTGSQTDAGTSVNMVSFYSISNAAGEDVTSHFTNIQTKNGQLTVGPALLTVWTGTAWKYYNGKPLVCINAGIRPVSGSESGSPDWENTAVTVKAVDGTRMIITLCGKVLIQAIDPLTGESLETELPAGQALTIGTAETEEGIHPVLQTAALKEDEIPETALRIYAVNPDVLAKACTEAGWDPQVMAGLIEKAGKTEDIAVLGTGLSIPEGLADAVITDAAGAVFGTVGGAAGFGQAAADPSIRVKAVGSQTPVGRGHNGYQINWGDADPANYTLNEDLGILAVIEKPEELTGWIKNDNAWCYFDDSGAMATGLNEINGKWEMFSDNGVWLYTWQGN